LAALTSNTLFHFTSSLDNLVGILTNEFQPHYSLEDFSVLRKKPSAKEDMALAFPMVSFCDIPLSQASSHMSTYGSYALGLTKAWGQKRGLTPVMYVHSNAVTVRGLLALIKVARAGPDQKDAIMRHVTDLLLLLKPYTGRFWRGNRWIDDVRFYDEREWRFVATQDGKTPAMDKQAFMDSTERDKANKAIAPSRLRFTPSDIKYVIVRSESEVLSIIRDLERIKGKYSLDQVKLLTSRVISAEQIREDF